MSIKIMAQVWECEFNSLSHRLVLLALADYADDSGGQVYPSLARVAWKVGCTERHVQSAMAQLRKSGILIKVTDPSYRRPTEYRIDMSKATRKRPFMPEGVNITSPIETTRVNRSSQKGEQEFTTRVNRSSQKGEQEFTRTIIEPSGKPSDESSDSKRASRHKPRTPKSEAVEKFRGITGRYPNKVQITTIDARVTDLTLWFECVYEWNLRGYKPTNVKGMLDWYAKGGPPKSGAPFSAKRSTTEESFANIDAAMAKIDAQEALDANG